LPTLFALSWISSIVPNNPAEQPEINITEKIKTVIKKSLMEISLQ